MQDAKFNSAVDEFHAIMASSESPRIGSSIRQMRVEKAIKHLNMLQRDHCSTQEHIETVKLNLMTAHGRLIDLLSTGDLSRQDVSLIIFHLEEGMQSWAWLHDRQSLQLPGAVSEFHSVISTLIDTPSRSQHQKALRTGVRKVVQTSKLRSTPHLTHVRFGLEYDIIEDAFHDAIRSYEAGKWAQALSLFRSQESAIEVLVEMEERLVGYSDDITTWTSDFELGSGEMLRKDFEMQSAICLGTQLIHTGDLHFKEAETGDPDDLMGRALLAQDDYRAALQHVTEKDMELEGTALARLARFHAKITKLPIPAHQLYLRAVQLAVSLSPVLPKGEWYAESVAAVQRHRDELEAEENKKWQARRQPILEKLADEMAKLQGAAAKEDKEFCKFVYETWPPKTEGGVEIAEPFNRKQLLKVIQRYHTDKNSGFGDEWLVLSEEISKALGARYNLLK